MTVQPRGLTVRRDAGIYGYERALRRAGLDPVAGVDEAGRGACAGPLVAAAVVLPEGRRGLVPGLADSKLLTARARERCYDEVLKRADEACHQMEGETPALRQVWDAVKRASPTNATVLLLGESGVGKELVARSIHRNSLRSRERFVQVNCAAIPEELIESELFGHEKGSFTGATEKQIGKFEQADRGTIFLDEVGDMSAKTQAKVLRVLQEGEVERL